MFTEIDLYEDTIIDPADQFKKEFDAIKRKYGINKIVGKKEIVKENKIEEKKAKAEEVKIASTIIWKDVEDLYDFSDNDDINSIIRTINVRLNLGALKIIGAPKSLISIIKERTNYNTIVSNNSIVINK